MHNLHVYLTIAQTLKLALQMKEFSPQTLKPNVLNSNSVCELAVPLISLEIASEYRSVKCEVFKRTKSNRNFLMVLS